VLNLERYQIREGRQVFVLDLSGSNSITGAGQIGPITATNSNPRVLTIQNVKDVSLSNIDLHTEDVNLSGYDFRDMAIIATGAVVITGKVDNSDQDDSGDGGASIMIQANAIDVNQLDTRGMRSSSPRNNGNVLLQALSPLGNYDPNDSVNNAFTNKLTVRGMINTAGPGGLQSNVALQAVVLQLVSGIIETPIDATKDLQVGVVRGGASAANLFVDVSNSGLTAQYIVEWGGTATLPPGSPPAFTVKPVSRPNAAQDVGYAQTLAGSATDPNVGDTLTYGKSSGPAWLQIATNGALSGTPTVLDAGTNTWGIWVTDGTRFDATTLRIIVVAGPRWLTTGGILAYSDGIQNTPYNDTLATAVIYYGAGSLTYSKLAGPAWLNVAANGTLSGTPAQSDTYTNLWTVSVTDGTYTTNATLRIKVNGSPKFLSSPVLTPRARVGISYLHVGTLAGSAIDPQGLSLSYSKASGPAWLSVASDGALSGTPAAGDVGTNQWTITANDGTYPATTGALRIVVLATMPTGLVEVVSQELWDGLWNPHAADGVTLTNSISEPIGDGNTNQATYTIPRGMRIYGNGSIHLNPLAGGGGTNIVFYFPDGSLTMDGTNNYINTSVHGRKYDDLANFIMDFGAGGTNNILGSGQIIGLTYNTDTPRITTITNVNNLQMANIDLSARGTAVRGEARPLFIYANGTVEVTGKIDNSDQDPSGEGSWDVNVFAREILVKDIDTRCLRTGTGTRPTGKINLKALAPPGYSPTDGANNTAANRITIRGLLVSTNNWTSDLYGQITSETVILRLESNASLRTAATKLTLNVGKVRADATAGDLLVNQSGGAYTAAYVVDWSGTIAPARPTLWFETAPAGQVSLHWSGTGFVLQQNPDASNPGGWVAAPTGTNMPAVVPIGGSNLFYRLKWPL